MTAQEPIAIIGMSCRLPGAPNTEAFWQNLSRGTHSVTEIPADRWNWRDYHGDPQKEQGKTHSKWGGFIDDVPFDPVSYGIPPSSLPLAR